MKESAATAETPAPVQEEEEKATALPAQASDEWEVQAADVSVADNVKTEDGKVEV